MKPKDPQRTAAIREAVFRHGMTYPAAAGSLGLTIGQVAGVAHRTPHRLRSALTARS